MGSSGDERNGTKIKNGLPTRADSLAGRGSVLEKRKKITRSEDRSCSRERSGGMGGIYEHTT